MTAKNASRMLPWVSNPHGLVSLWDMLGEFYGDLVVISSYLTRAHLHFRTTLAPDASQELVDAKAEEDRLQADTVRGTLPVLERLAALLGMASVAAQAERVRTLLDRPAGSTYDAMESAVFDLLSRLADELKARRFYYLPAYHAALYESQQPLGNDFESAFPSVVFDSREAAKCLALDRSTACVLHLMRVLDGCMQHGINPRLGITSTRPSWGAYIRAIRTAVATKPKLAKVNWMKDAAFFSQLADDLDAIRLVWRNPATHDVAQQYSSEEAATIMAAVRHFVTHLSRRVRELKRR
ncbi:MAG TPA: hypothetical protein VGD01_04175 [Candidatus Elarobacter sp.]|jgi:hypothetical protein